MKRARFQKAKDEAKRIAKERINELFLQAEKADEYSLKKRYVELARKIGTKFRVRIPPQYKRRYCRFCGAYFIPSKNVTVRLKNQKVIYHCLECKQYTRLPYVREIEEKRLARLKNRKEI
jgi:ribonuclease P protein subunit RPR2